MHASRYAIALIGSVAMLGGSALAAPPLVGGGIGGAVSGAVSGAAHIGGPSIGVPPVNVPAIGAPKANVPQANARANAGADLNAQVSNGTLTAISGDTVTVRLANGTTQTYTVSDQTAAELRSMIGKPVAYRIENGVLTVAGHEGNVPLHATVSSVSGNSAVLRLANGTTQSYTVTAQQAAWLKAHTGKSVTFWTGANGSLQLNQESNSTKPHPHKTK